MNKTFKNFIDKNVDVDFDFSKIASKINYEKCVEKKNKKSLYFTKKVLAFALILAILVVPTTVYMINNNTKNVHTNNAQASQNFNGGILGSNEFNNSKEENFANGVVGGVSSNSSYGGEMVEVIKFSFSLGEFVYMTEFFQDISEIEITLGDEKIYLESAFVQGVGVCEIYKFTNSKKSLAVKIDDKFYRFDVSEYSGDFKKDVEFVYEYDEQEYLSAPFIKDVTINLGENKNKLGQDKANELFGYFLDAYLDNDGNINFHNELYKKYVNQVSSGQGFIGTVENTYEIEFETVLGSTFTCFYHKTYWEENKYVLLFEGYYKISDEAVDIILR